jgi:hypothetical protein
VASRMESENCSADLELVVCLLARGLLRLCLPLGCGGACLH